MSIEARKLRILVITALYPPYHFGGYELRCQDVVERLRARGHQVRVITNTYGVGRRQVEGDVARVLHLISPSRSLLQYVATDTADLWYIRRAIKDLRPDVVHLWFMCDLAKTIFPFLARTGLPIVYDEGGNGLVAVWRGHGPWIRFCEGCSSTRFKTVSKRILCPMVSLLTGNILPWRWAWPHGIHAYFNSRGGLERTLAAGVPLAEAQVIYSGVDLNLLAHHRHEWPVVPVRLLIPGRVDPVKGIRDALLAVAALDQLAPECQARLTVAGSLVEDQGYAESLKHEAGGLGLGTRVEFLGAVEATSMPRIYHGAHICLFLSHQIAGLSRVPLEAMASGAVVVATGNEGSSELVKDGETGFLVPTGDPVAVASVVKRLFENPELYADVAQRARQHMEQSFSIERAVDQIEQVLVAAAVPSSG